MSRELVLSLFEYRDNNLFWKNNTHGSVDMSQPAGYINDRGYRHIFVIGRSWKAHHLVFLYFNGYLPKFIDHIDGVCSNNDISNLRECTLSENNRNKKAHRNSKSSFLGVSWHKGNKKWQVRVTVEGKSKCVGYSLSEKYAAFVYNKFAHKHYGEFAKLNDLVNGGQIF